MNEEELIALLHSWGEPGEAAAAIIRGLPGAELGEANDQRIELMTRGETIATMQPAGDTLLVECDIDDVREALLAAGLASVLPAADRARWTVPPEDVDTPIAVLRAKAAAM